MGGRHQLPIRSICVVRVEIVAGQPSLLVQTYIARQHRSVRHIGGRIGRLRLQRRLMESLRLRPVVQPTESVAQPIVDAVRCVRYWQDVQRLAIRGHRALQFALLRVQIAQLAQRGDARRIVGAAVAQTDALELGAFVQHGGGLVAAAERNQRSAQVEVGH